MNITEKVNIEFLKVFEKILYNKTDPDTFQLPANRKQSKYRCERSRLCNKDSTEGYLKFYFIVKSNLYENFLALFRIAITREANFDLTRKCHLSVLVV